MKSYTRRTKKARRRSSEKTAQLLAVFDTDLGWMAAVWRASVLAQLTFGHDAPNSALARLSTKMLEPSTPDRFMATLIRRLRAFAKGHCADSFHDVKLDTDRLTEFQHAVIRECRRIPIGATVSYGEVARRAGYAGAARAVGSVMSSNRFPLIVPCHRVVAASSVGGFSSPQGLKMKHRLLAAEAEYLATQG